MLYKVIKASKGYFTADLIIWLIAHNLPLLIAVYIKDYFDMKRPLVIVMAIAALIVIRIVFIRIGARIDIKAQQHWAKSFYLMAYKSMQEGFVDLEADNGQLLNSLNEDVDSIISTISYAIDTICNVIYGFIAIVILLTINVGLTILILCLPLIAITINSLIKKRVTICSERIKEASNRFSSDLNFLIQNSRMIRVNHNENDVFENIEGDIHKQTKAGYHYSSWLGVLNSITNMITECNILVILLVYMQSSTLTAGAIILFITYSFDLAAMSQYVSALIISVQSTKVYIQNFERKFCSMEKQDTIQGTTQEATQGSVEGSTQNSMHNQTYMPNMTEWGITDITPSIIEGKVNVLIGRNAAGKSTMLHYLYHKIPGSVMLPDRYHIFRTTILENICLGSYHEEALKSAYDTACLDLDLDYICQNNLSGGQEFRIVLARTIYHSGDYILIDSNLASVDEKAREHILNNLDGLKKTIILTDHIERDLYQRLNCIYV